MSLGKSLSQLLLPSSSSGLISFSFPSYSLPNGVRRWERGFHSEQQHGLVVEGFSAEPRHYGKGVQYELRCYRADSRGYQPLTGIMESSVLSESGQVTLISVSIFTVEYLPQPPRVRRFELPNIPCFNTNRLRP